MRPAGQRRADCTPDSVIVHHLSQGPTVTSLIPAWRGLYGGPWRSLAWWVLPTLTVRAATRPNRRSTIGTGCPIGQPWVTRLRTAWARPTRLAPRRTLAQPATSPLPLVGSYPTVSPLTRTLRLLRAAGGSALCCGCSQRRPEAPAAPTYRFVGHPCPAPKGQGRESGSSSEEL